MDMSDNSGQLTVTEMCLDSVRGDWFVKPSHTKISTLYSPIN